MRQQQKMDGNSNNKKMEGKSNNKKWTENEEKI